MPTGPTLEVQEDLQIVFGSVGDEVQQIPDGDKGDITVSNAGNTWTVNKNAILNKTTETAVGTDYILISDSSDSGNVKKALASDLIDVIADGDKGDIVVSSGGNTWTIENNAVTNTKSAQMATKTYKGRTSAGTGNAEDVSVATLKTDLVLVKGDVGLGNVDNTSDTTKNSASVTLTNKTIALGSNTVSGTLAEFNTALTGADFATGGGTATGTNTGDQTITLTSDVTGSGTGSFATTIANNAVTTAKIADNNVTFAKIENISTDHFLGRHTSGSGNVQQVSATQARSILNVEDGAEVNTVDSVNGQTGDVVLDKTDIGLDNVDNTSDANKPISTATQIALGGKTNNVFLRKGDIIVSKGNGNDGTVAGGLTISSNAMVFNGTDAKVNTSYKFPFAGDFSFGFWIKRTEDWANVVGNYFSDTFITASSGRIQIELRNNSLRFRPDGAGLEIAATFLTLNEWVFVVWTWSAWDGAEHTHRVYTNAVQGGLVSATIQKTATTVDFSIGRTVSYKSFEIKDVVIYNRILSASEVTTIYTAGQDAYSPIQNGLVAQYSGRDFLGTTSAPTTILDTATETKRLPIGPNNTYLMADSTQDTGVIWDNLELKTRIRNGGLLNGYIRATVASNNLTLAISTSSSSQVDPTAANPVYVWIGDTLRSITGALSIAANAGTNWFNSGSSELATKEIDYFAYIGYNATDGVVLGYARIPYARLYSDFNATTTNEKYARISTITNAASGDNYINIGRFAATLSATASFNWSVPSFTNANLIQEPIYETRVLSYQPVYSANGSMTYTSNDTFKAIYQVRDRTFYVNIAARGTTGGTASTQLLATTPFSFPDSNNSRYIFAGDGYDGAAVACVVLNSGADKIRWVKNLDTNWGLGSNKFIYASGIAPLVE